MLQNVMEAVVVDLSVIVNALSNRKSMKPKTFAELCTYVIKDLIFLCKGVSRIYYFTDTY